MTTENDVKDLPKKENSASLKKEKNPKRVAGGKKVVEARKIKAELKRKEAELLKKASSLRPSICLAVVNIAVKGARYIPNL
jgi:hypothetical protein